MNLMTVIQEGKDIAYIVAAGVGLLSVTDMEGPEKKKALVDAIVAEAPDLGIKTPAETVRKIASVAVELIYLLGKVKGILGGGAS